MNTSALNRIANQLSLLYSCAPIVDSSLRAAYRALSLYVHDRFQDLIRDGWSVLPIKNDKYLPNLVTAAYDQELFVLDGFHNHPLLSDTTNYMFRAVHDWVGHIPIATGDNSVDYSLRAEIEAFKRQAVDLMYYAYAWQWRKSIRSQCLAILFTEIVGQAAYFHTHGNFPPQKACVLTPACDKLRWLERYSDQPIQEVTHG